MISKIKFSHSLISAFILAVFFLIVILLWGSIAYVNLSIKAEQTAEIRRTEFKQLGINFADASDYLTDEARKFAVTGDVVHMNKYWEEINKTKTRDKVIYEIIELNAPEAELSLLAEAKKNSDGLVETEKRSMKLILSAQDVAVDRMPPEVAGFHLSEQDQNLSKEEKLAKARDIMFDEKYDADKKTIMNPIASFQKNMNTRLDLELQSARRATVRAEILQIILAFIIIGTIAVLLRIIFTQLTIPIKNFTKVLRDLKSNNKDFRIMPEGSLELRMLANTFNDIYYSLQEELFKRKKAEETMKVAKDEAELANRAKSDFLAIMSHEIRTPLNAIIGYEYMISGTDLTEKQKGYSSKISVSAKNLLGVISDILDFSKIEAKKLLLESVSFDLNEILKEIFSMVYFEVNRKGLKFSYSIGSDVPRYLKGDPTRLKQVILNLISNGIKFTQKGNLNVNIELLEKKGEKVNISFSVTDSGIGISEEQKKILFEPFMQADISTTRNYGGTGLGLAISKEIVELMGGKLRVESEIGKGSTFSFNAKFIIANKIPVGENTFNTIEGIELFRGRKILLVEDNEINLEMTKEILENLGLNTDTAKSGSAAIKKIQSNNYDMVLMDIQMPKMDGYEATRRIRRLKNKKQMRIIALSADVIEGAERIAKDAGMDAYITKPLNVEKIVKTLESFFYVEISEEISHSQPSWNSCGDTIIDYEQAIRILGGKKARYKNIMEQFITNHKQDAETFYKLISIKNWKEAKMLIHTLKGVSGNICAVKLNNLCKSIEQALLRYDEAELSNLKIPFYNTLEELILYAEEIISTELKEEILEYKIEEVGNIDNILLKLFRLLQAGDSQAKDYFQSSRHCLQKQLKKKDYIKLCNKILSYDFEQAASDLHEIINRIKVKREA